MVFHHWSNDGMVTYHHRSLDHIDIFIPTNGNLNQNIFVISMKHWFRPTFLSGIFICLFAQQDCQRLSDLHCCLVPLLAFAFVHLLHVLKPLPFSLYPHHGLMPNWIHPSTKFHLLLRLHNHILIMSLPHLTHFYPLAVLNLLDSLPVLLTVWLSGEDIKELGFLLDHGFVLSVGLPLLLPCLLLLMIPIITLLHCSPQNCQLLHQMGPGYHFA